MALAMAWRISGACATASCLSNEPATRGDAAAAAWLHRCYYAAQQGGARMAACDACCLAPQRVGVLMVSAWCHCHHAVLRGGVCGGAGAVARVTTLSMLQPRCTV